MQELNFSEPSLIEGEAREAELETASEEELYARGLVATQSHDEASAAAAFETLARRYGSSPRAGESLLRAGRSYRALGRLERALACFEALLREPGGREAEEARLLGAETLEMLGRRAEARASLGLLAERSPDPETRGRALTERAILEFGDGELEAAESSLALALAAFGQVPEVGRSSHARARFYLGELSRERFLGLAIDTGLGNAELEDVLERKAQLLLAAQERYLEAARARDPGVAVASLARIGELYQAFDRELAAAPLPSGLDPAGARLYRALLDEKLRVLRVKAAEAYAETIEAARHAGLTDSPFAAGAAKALEEMERLLSRDDAPTSEEDPP